MCYLGTYIYEGNENKGTFHYLVNDSEKYITSIEFKKDEEVKKSAKANNEDMFVKSVFPKVFSEKTSKAYKESATSYKKLFESKEFYNAIMKSLGNVIYRILNSDDTIRYSETSEEDSNTELKVAEDSEEYKTEKKKGKN